MLPEPAGGRLVQPGQNGHRSALGDEPALEVVPRPLGQLHAEAGAFGRHPCQYPRKERSADTRRRDQRQAALVEALQRRDRGARRHDAGDDLAGMPGEHLTRRRRGGRSASAVQQPHPELALERGDVRTDPGLGTVDLLGSSGEPAPVHDREKGLQPVQVHAPEDPPPGSAFAPGTPPQDRSRTPGGRLLDACSGWSRGYDALVTGRAGMLPSCVVRITGRPRGGVLQSRARELGWPGTPRRQGAP